MANTDHKKRFGMSTSVEDHMAILRVLAKNDNDAISRFWKSDAGDAHAKKTMLFHTLAMLDAPRLHAWIASTPPEWWTFAKREKPGSVGGSSKNHPGNRYDNIAGGMLQYLHEANKKAFIDLLQKFPVMFQSPTCRHYMEDWCQDLSPEHLKFFQPLLASQSSSWYVTNPLRINLLLDAPGPREDELMLSAAIAKDGVMHPLFEKKYPGMQACVHVAHGMLGDTKQKKQFIRQWMHSQNGPQKEALTLALPELDDTFSLE